MVRKIVTLVCMGLACAKVPPIHYSTQNTISFNCYKSKYKKNNKLQHKILDYTKLHNSQSLSCVCVCVC